MISVAIQPDTASQSVPGPRGIPFLGVGLQFIRDPLSYFEKMVACYGRVFKLPLGGTEIVFLNRAEDVEKILRLDFENFGMSERQEQLLKPLLGHSMPVTTDHLYWQQLHAIMLPMFTPKMLQRYFVQTLSSVNEEVYHLREYAESGKRVELLDFIRVGVFQALIRTLFIRGINKSEVPALLNLFDKSDTFVNARNLSGGSSLVWLLPKVREGMRCLRKIDKRVYELIDYRKANRADENEDMLDVLLAARKADGTALNDTELRDNIVALLFGGQETTPTVITWAFGLLAANPDKRDKMFEEIDRVLQGRAPTYQDLGKLEYTAMVLDEAMRLYPPFPFIGREVLADTSIGGFEVKKGTSLGFVGWTIHRDPNHWPDPEKFIPERHTKERTQARAKCAFISFGYGQRRCIGERVGRMEGMLMLALISQRFVLDHVNGELPGAHVQMSIKPIGRMPMQVTSRFP